MAKNIVLSLGIRQLLLNLVGPVACCTVFFAAGHANAQIVISQIYGGGGLAAALWRQDWVEIKNNGTSTINVGNYSLQYANASGISWTSVRLVGSIAPGAHYLIRLGPTNPTSGIDIPVTFNASGNTNISATTGKLALVSNTTVLAGACPTGAGIVDFVGYGSSANCWKGNGAAPGPTASTGLVRGSVGSSCVDTGANNTDFSVISYPLPRNTSSPAQPCIPQHCGAGVAITTAPTALWQQFSMPCTGRIDFSVQDVGTLLGGEFSPATYGSRWAVLQRNPTNTGNVPMMITENLVPGTGHWFKSLDQPNSGLIAISNLTARPTPLTTGLPGCQSAAGCAVLPVASGTPGTRMIANPLPYNVDWSLARVRVGGPGGTVYTPSGAEAAGFLSKQIWIWNGTSYASWSDAEPNIGNVQYFRSFFVRVLQGGEGQTIDLLLPGVASTITTPTTAAMAAGGSAMRAEAAEPTGSGVTRNAWLVDLRAENAANGWFATAKLGQWPGAGPGTEGGNLQALAPFTQPYLTLVFPAIGRRTNPGDYVTDLRPANGFANRWNFEVRAEPVGNQVTLRWNAPAQVLAKSRVIDLDTGAVFFPADPAYVNGYVMELTTPSRRLAWEYMGN